MKEPLIHFFAQIRGREFLEKKPSHVVSDFSSMPGLSEEEFNQARERYFKVLSETPLESFSPSEFRELLVIETSKSFSDKTQEDDKETSGKKKSLTRGDYIKLIEAVKKLREESKERHTQIIGDKLVLAYLQAEPTLSELDKAYRKMEQSLENVLEELEDPGMPLLLSFQSLVGDLLEDHPQYCLVAERALYQMEKDKEHKDNLMFYGMFASLAPCFIPTPITLALCLAGELVLGTFDFHDAEEAKDHSLTRALAGKDFEKIAELEGKQKDLELLYMLTPLILLEAGGVGAVIKKGLRGGLKGGLKGQNSVTEKPAIRGQQRQRIEDKRQDQ